MRPLTALRSQKVARKPSWPGQRLKAEVILVKNLAVASAVLAVLVGLGACARDSDTSAGTGPIVSTDLSTPATTTDPLVLCRQALPDRVVVSATRTSVGDLRSWGFSGPVQKRPLANVFPSAASSDPAAWCWTRAAVDSYTAWGVHASDTPRRAITATGPTDVVPAGPPLIP